MTSGHSNVSVVDSGLDAAYRATAYVVALDQGRISIRVDQHCKALDQLLHARGSKEWAFISACNPGSQPLPEKLNNERHAQLVVAVEKLGLSYYSGQGIPVSPGWQPECSLLILGIKPEDALQLAAQFGQNAILVGTSKSKAQLCYVHGNSL